jgi:replicative DNA helicase
MSNELEIFQSDLRPMQYWHVRAGEKLDTWAKGVPEGYSTGFKSLDTYSRLVASELTLIAARPSQGKTAIAMQMVETVARKIQHDGDGGCVAVFSAEMSGWSLYVRLASALCGVNTHKLRMGKGTPEEVMRLREAMDTLRSLPIWIDDNTGPTTAQMLTQLARLNEDIPVRMMMFDFMELGGDRAQKEDLRISTIAHNLKGIAKTLQIPVIALSQLNRDVENRANKMPTLSDLRYSGMLEQIADTVLFVMRPEYYVERAQSIDVPDEDKRGVAYIQFAKNRNGPVGLAKLAFVKDRIMFADLATDEVMPGVRR